MATSTRRVSCSYCGFDLPDEHMGPCSRCGKAGRTIAAGIAEEQDLASSFTVPISKQSSEFPEILLQAELIVPGEAVPDGVIICAAAIPWLAIYKEIKRDSEFMFFFANLTVS